jgi:hypothetical protein
MAAAVSRVRVPSSQPYGGVDRGTDRLLQLRLPNAEISILKWCFTWLEGQVGLASNFGAMCDRVHAGSLHVEEPTYGPRPYHALRIPPSVMHVKHAPTWACASAEPGSVEGWACWSNHGTSAGRDRLGTAVLRAREALLAIGVAHAVCLYRMYGQDTPRLFYARYPGLKDLAPIAEDAELVVAHAAKMTSLDEGRERGLRVVTNGREALSDLLEPKSGEAKALRVRREEIAKEIYRQAHRSLVEASNAYRKAKGR